MGEGGDPDGRPRGAAYASPQQDRDQRDQRHAERDTYRHDDRSQNTDQQDALGKGEE